MNSESNNNSLNEDVLDETVTSSISNNKDTDKSKKDVDKSKKAKKLNPSFFKEIKSSFKEMFRLSFKTLKFTWKILNSSNVDLKDSKIAKKIKFFSDKLGITQKKISRLEDEKRKLQLELRDNVVENKNPKTYVYKVKDKNGKVINGKFSALSKTDVNSFLLNEGYEVYKIENNKTIDFVYGESSFISTKWRNKDLIFWLTQLSTYIKSGITLMDAIKILTNQMGSRSKKTTMQAICYELTMGNPFSVALEKQGNAFPPLLINMLRAAEATGDLEATLDDMANYYEEIDETRRQMVNALTYPCLVLIFAIGVIIFIILYVVPQFEGIYDSNNMEITGLTKIVLQASEFLQNYIFYVILALISAVAALIICYRQIKLFRKSMQIFFMHVPVIKNVLIYNEVAVFTKTFASLLKNNVFITESIDILSKITNNEVYKEIMYETIDNISKGDKISTSFKDHWAVPEVAYYMIVTGESTGELAEMLDTVSHYFQEQHKSIVNNLKTFIEPITIMLLAVIVGVIIISILIPMFDMMNKIM